TDDPAYQRGLKFLIDAQREDGSWLVRSRSKPFQLYFESGFPHGKDQFISIAASGWATTALAFAVPRVAEQIPAPQKTDFDRWEKGIAAFEQQDKDKPPPKNAILFVGSSSIRLWDVAKSFPGMEVINRGFGGSQLADSVHFAPRLVLKHEPRTVVLYAGDN